MAKGGKKYKKAREHVSKGQKLAITDAFSKVKELAFASFDESVDVDVNLSIDPTKGDQVVRGSVVLPHGNGKKVKIAVFARGDQADKAKEAGADYVGDDDLIKKIAGGWLDFTQAVATPDMMPSLGKLAKILGPRGLLPNKKIGTVSDDVAAVVTELKKGKAFFKNDKGGLLHLSLGRVSYDSQKLEENFAAFMKVLSSSKPSAAKGRFIQKITVSSTMGPGVNVNFDEYNK